MEGSVVPAQIVLLVNIATQVSVLLSNSLVLNAITEMNVEEELRVSSATLKRSQECAKNTSKLRAIQL
jgi:hypothetical protein